MHLKDQMEESVVFQFDRRGHVRFFKVVSIWRAQGRRVTNSIQSVGAIMP